MEILKINNVHKQFGPLEVLRGISLTVNRGEVMAIIGPSGSGKSTLLRCSTHLEEVSAGSISVCDRYMVKDGCYAASPVLREICLNIGLVFQNFNLFPHLSVLENVNEAQLRVLRRSKSGSTERSKQLLERIGLADKAFSYPFELSGGQQQRVSIARALALDPQILFFDEPTSALDPELTGEILKVIRSLADGSMTMVIVTHEMAFARDVADRIIFMDGGVIVEEGPAKDLIDSPREERTRAFLRGFR